MNNSTGFAKLDAARKALARFDAARAKIQSARLSGLIPRGPIASSASDTAAGTRAERSDASVRDTGNESAFAMIARIARSLKVHSTANLSLIRILTSAREQRGPIATDYSALQDHEHLRVALSPELAINNSLQTVASIHQVAAQIAPIMAPNPIERMLSSGPAFAVASESPLATQAGIRQPGLPGANSPSLLRMFRFEAPRFADVPARPESYGASGTSLSPITLNSSPTVVVQGGGMPGDIERHIVAALLRHREEIFNQMKHEAAVRERMDF
jgi:hypothetical protein